MNIVLRGEVGDNQSCGVVNIGLCVGLEANGVNVSIDPKSIYASAPQFVVDRINRKLLPDIVIDHGLPHQMNGLGTDRPWMRVALVFWDSDLLTKEAADCLNKHTDAVIVHTEFTKKACVDAGVIKPILVGAAGVFKERYKKRELHNGPFRFLFTGVAQGRKGVQEAITAFESVLGNNPEAELMIKSNSWGVVKDYTVTCDNVHRIHEEYDRQKFIEFVRQADCFVCPSKGDSFMFPGLEAMACGLPLIITDFGGPTQYCNEKTGYPVKYDLMKCHYLAGHQAEPDMKHLAETMLYVFNNRSEAYAKGDYGYRWAQDYWDWRTDAKRLIEGLNEIRNKKS